MELYFLDESFVPLTGAMEEFTSVVWSERYFENGSFTLHFPRELLPAALDAVYVRTGLEDGRMKCGRVTYLSVDNEEGEGDCVMGGFLLESLLDDRVLAGRGCCTGTLTEAVYAAVEENLRDCGVVLGESEITAEDEVSLTYEWDTLSDWLYSVLRPFGASYRIELDPETNVPVFRLVAGVDRSSGFGETVSENYNTWQAVFSASFGNITSLRFERDVSGMKNVAYVEGTDGTTVVVDQSGGGPKRELYRCVSDVKPDDFGSTDAYAAALRQRGAEILANYPASVCVAAETDTGVSPRYGVDYRLGDICDVADDTLGLSFGMRLTAVDDVTEYGLRTLYPSFGEEVRQIRRLVPGKRG
ncbi:MAG: hypothetical protein ACI4V1_07105 [Eubacteriales bacterium]